jgi:hypothetical protein
LTGRGGVAADERFAAAFSAFANVSTGAVTRAAGGFLVFFVLRARGVRPSGVEARRSRSIVGAEICVTRLLCGIARAIALGATFRSGSVAGSGALVTP